MKKAGPLPELDFTVDDSCEGRLGFSVDELQKFALSSLPLCAERTGPHEAPFLSLSEIGIVIVSDDKITQIHGDFMNDSTPTDVITFHHGEIIISLDTAVSVANEIGHPPMREALLYITHGFLHLNGHHDYEMAERDAMHKIQDSILEEIWPFPAGESP